MSGKTCWVCQARTENQSNTKVTDGHTWCHDCYYWHCKAMLKDLQFDLDSIRLAVKTMKESVTEARKELVAHRNKSKKTQEVK